MSIETNSAADRFVRYPFGEADVLNIDSAAAMTATIKNSKTQLTISQMSAAGTLDVALHPELSVGDELTVKVSADGTGRVLTLGDGLTGNNFTVTANKSATLTFEFDGSSFVNTGAILNS